MESNMKAPDIHEQRLAEETVALKKCQKQYKVDSCMKCKKVIGCELRKRYVNAVYQSMNKGAGGGFEF
jgi:hypothetical protein